MKGNLNVDLLRVFRKKRIFLLEVSEEVIKGANVENEKLLIEILRINTKDFTKKEKERMREIKERAADILEKRFLNEKSIDAILNCKEINLKKCEEVANEYLKSGGEDKYILMKIAELPFSQKTKDTALEKLLKNPTVMELVLAFQEGGEKIQQKALEEALKTNLTIEDICFLIMIAKPEIAERIFEEKLEKTGKIRELTEEDLEEIKLSDSEELTSWARKKLIEILTLKKERLREEEFKILKRKERVKILKDAEREGNAMITQSEIDKVINIWREIEEIERKIEKLKEEKKSTP